MIPLPSPTTFPAVVDPARAGMIREIFGNQNSGWGRPRASGDDPYTIRCDAGSFSVDPARAGMIPQYCSGEGK